MKNKNNKLIKFLLVVKKLWYVVLAPVVCFVTLGYFVGVKKSVTDTPFPTEQKYYVLTTHLIISSADYQDFSESFNNSCLYFMISGELIVDSVKAVDANISDV